MLREPALGSPGAGTFPPGSSGMVRLRVASATGMGPGTLPQRSRSRIGARGTDNKAADLLPYVAKPENWVMPNELGSGVREVKQVTPLP